MKNALIVWTLLLFTSIGQAQTHNGLQGPAAKNYKPWMHKTKASTPVFLVSTPNERLQGPAAKNYKPWLDKKANKESIVQTTDKKTRLQGPKAKNYKPWIARRQKAKKANED